MTILTIILSILAVAGTLLFLYVVLNKKILNQIARPDKSC